MKLLYRVLDAQKAQQFVAAPNPSQIRTTGDIGDFHPDKPGSLPPSYWTDSFVYAQELQRMAPNKMVVMQHFPLQFLNEQRIGSPTNGSETNKVFYFPAKPEQTWVDVGFTFPTRLGFSTVNGMCSQFVASNRGGVQPPAGRRLATSTNFNVCVGPVSNTGKNQYTAAALAKQTTLQAQIDNFQPYWIGEPNPAAKTKGIEEYAKLGKSASQWYEDQKAQKANAPFAMQYVFLNAGLTEICKPEYARGYATALPSATGAGTYTWSYNSGVWPQPLVTAPYNYNPIEHLLHENPASINANSLTTTNCAACKSLSTKV